MKLARPTSLTSSPAWRLSAVALALLPLSAAANQSLSSTGYGLTVGPVFNRSNLSSVAFNPANAVALVGDDEKWRIGVLQVGGRYELGQLDDVVALKDQINADIKAAQNNVASEVTRIASSINTEYFPKLESGARLSAQGQASLGAPVLFRSLETLPGVWSFNAVAHAQMSGRFKSADVQVLSKFKTNTNSDAGTLNLSLGTLASDLQTLETALTDLSGSSSQQQSALETLKTYAESITDQELIDTLKATAANPSNGLRADFAVTSASAFDFKLAEINQISLGYARDVSHLLPNGLRELAPSAKLDVGLRLNAYQANLYRQLGAFVDAEGNANTIELNKDGAYLNKATAVGLDLGAMWGDDHYQLGATVYNLNSPKFDYPNPAKDPNAANSAAAQALAAAGKLNLQESVHLKPHLVLEGSVFSMNKRWLLQGSTALTETNDFVGEPQKIATVSVSYNAERFDSAWLEYLVPSVRLGYRQNMVGTKLSTIGLGFTWGVFNLDLNASTQKVNADGTSVPRSAGISFSVAERF